MALNFPNNPNAGDTYESWQYNGSSWEPITSLDLTFTQNGTDAVERQLVDKLREKISVKDFGAVGDGVTDDTDKIQAAIDYAGSLSIPQSPSILAPNNIEVNLLGKAYAITSALFIDKSIKFTNGRLIALPGFNQGDNSGFMLEIVNGAEDCIISDLFLDGGLTEVTPGTPGTFTRHANLIWVKCRQVSIVNCEGAHFPDYGIRIGDVDSTVEQFAKTASLVDCTMNEWLFGEDGKEYPELKTARGYSLESFQGLMDRCTSNLTKYPVYMDCTSWYISKLRTSNGQESTDNGGVLTDNQIGVFINSGYNVLDNCTFGSGYVHINGVGNDTTVPSRTTISNSEFVMYNNTSDTHILYETDQVDDTCYGLVITNNRFGNGNNVDPIIFRGVNGGSLVPDIEKKITWVGNVDFFETAINTSLGFDTKFGAGIQFDGGDITCETINSYQPRYVLKNNITLTVGPDPEHDFEQLNQAVIYLRDFSIPPGASVTVDISDGNYASVGSLDFSHHDGHRITYRAANGLVTPGVVPVRTDFTGDYNTDYATVSAKYNTIIDCERSGALVRDSTVKIQDILFRYVGEPFIITDPYDGLNLINSRARVTGCTFWGFPNHGVTCTASYMSSTDICVAYNDNQNYRLVDNSVGTVTDSESTLVAVSGNNSITLNHSSSLQAPRVEVLSARETGFTIQGSSSNYTATTSASDIDYSYYIDSCKRGISINHNSYFKAVSATIINIETTPVVVSQNSFLWLDRVFDASSTSGATTFTATTNSTIYLTDSQGVSANFTYNLAIDQHEPSYSYGFEAPKGTIQVLADS